MKKTASLLLLLFSNTIIFAQKAQFLIEFIKIDSIVNTMGLSMVSVRVTNQGDSAEIFRGNSSVGLCAKKSNQQKWTYFSNNYFSEHLEKKLLPNENVVVEGLHMNLLELFCPNENNENLIETKPIRIFIKASIYSNQNENVIYSDSSEITVLPFHEADRIAFDYIKQHLNPSIYTQPQLGNLDTSEKLFNESILNLHSNSIFVDLIRIQRIFHSFGNSYNLELHNNNKISLSKIEHREYEFIRYLIKRIEYQFANVGCLTIYEGEQNYTRVLCDSIDFSPNRNNLYQKSGLSFKILKYDTQVNAFGLSNLKILVENKGQIIENFSSVSCCARKPENSNWKSFEGPFYHSNATTIKPGEARVFDIDLSILQLICNYPNEMGDLATKPQRIYYKAMTYSMNHKTFIFSDSIEIEITPLSQFDMIAIDSINAMWQSPLEFTRPDRFIMIRGAYKILSEHPKSTFAKLVQIGQLFESSDLLYSSDYTPELYAQVTSDVNALQSGEFTQIEIYKKQLQYNLAKANCLQEERKKGNGGNYRCGWSRASCIFLGELPRKSGLILDIIKIAPQINAMGLSMVTIRVSNKGSEEETFPGSMAIDFLAQKANGGAWKRFSSSYMLESNDKIIQPNEILIFELNLNILQLVCLYPEEMGDLINLRQKLNIKGITLSLTCGIDVLSDSVVVDITPLNLIDKMAFDSIQTMDTYTQHYTGVYEILFGSFDKRFDWKILDDHPKSTFADLIRISKINYDLSYFGEKPYTKEKHILANTSLSNVKHTEFDFVKFCIQETQKKLDKAEKKGFSN
jgi:hypothetical protein